MSTLDDHTVERLRERARSLLTLASLTPDTAACERELAALDGLVDRLRNTYPFHEARYAGQMLKPPHPVAWAAYATAMLLNPNNHALDGGPATAALEREAVAALARMLGHERHLGHLTSSGTLANLEALWVARELHPDGTVVLGDNAHYTHSRICDLLRVPHETVAQDGRGRIDVDALERRLRQGGVATVVATLGTTALGALDDLERIGDLCAEHGTRLHVDAAYGGFFALVLEHDSFTALPRADSIVVDPHKHGLQPYGCGCVIFADPAVGRLYAHDSPYTYFTSPELHPGEVTLECSRPGAAAAALWTTLQALPLTPEGLGRHLRAARSAAVGFAEELRRDSRVGLLEPELDIVCFYRRERRASEITAATERAFLALGDEGWHLAKLRVDARWLPGAERDADHATVLRSCLMKRSHAAIAGELASAVRHAFGLS